MDDQAQGAVDSSEASIMDALDKRLNPVAEEPKEETQPEQTEEPETAQEVPDEELEEAGPNAEEDGQDASQPDLSAVKVPVTYKGDDGNDVTEELPLEEIRSGYMRAKDYTLKTQEVSKARAAIPQAVEQGVSEARNQYTTGLQQLHALVQHTVVPELANVDWQKLAQENPSEYVAKSARAQQINALLSELSQQHQAETQRAQDARKQAADREAADSVEVLKQAIPNFSLEKYQGILQGALKEYGKHGLTREQVEGISGAVPILVLNDALAYRALQAKKPAMQKTIAQAPVAIKPGASRSRAETKNAHIAPLQAQLKKSGDLDDAVALYAARHKG